MIKPFPNRQKILLAIVAAIVIFLIAGQYYKWLEPEQLERYILFFSIGVPISLLVFETLMDLHDNRVFIAWLMVADVCFVFYLLPKFGVHFTGISGQALAPLKSILAFLIAYKFCDAIMVKRTGNRLINTHWKSDREDETDRRISNLDILFNIILYAVIIIAILTK